MKTSIERRMRIGVLCISSLLAAFVFCPGCSVHEEHRLGQAEDMITHLLAGGAYLSLLAFVLLGIAFVSILWFE
jgi:hypothetical protein